MKILNSYASGKGLRAIANSLNKEGYKTKRGNSFSTASIKEIIRQNELEASLKGCDLEELTYEYVQEVMSHLNEILKGIPNDERKAFYHMIIEEIVVNQEKQIEMIKLKIDKEIQKDLMKQSLSNKKSDRDILMRKNNKRVRIEI